jgi:hypothetical protein
MTTELIRPVLIVPVTESGDGLRNYSQYLSADGQRVELSVMATGVWNSSLESDGDGGVSSTCAGRSLAWRVGTPHDIVVTITISAHMKTTVTSVL